jgi:putative (di)nucleoside polyphosphate hydrolase
MRFTGEHANIRLDAHDPPEFLAWKWVDPAELPGLIVPFKRRVYEAVVREFAELI